MNIPAQRDLLCFREPKDNHMNMDALGGLIVDDLASTNPPCQVEPLGKVDSRSDLNLLHENSRIQAKLFQAEKLATLGTFASGIAHDINNPLYVMIGFAGNILSEQDFEVIREQAQSIVDAGKRIQMTCRNITQYARATNGRDPVKVDVTHTLNEAVKIAQYASALQALSVVKRYDACSLEVLANPEELLQVLVNLMTNSIQAMKGNGTLTLSSWDQDDIANISISDTGCGIASENLEKIFQPFFTTKPSGEGTGLGLHNVRAIIKKYNGKLSVESQLGKGTSFLIQFPKASIH